MKFNSNILCVFTTIVLTTLAVPTPNNEVSAATDLSKRQPTEASLTVDLVRRQTTGSTITDLVKRQEPRKYQEVYLNLRIFQALAVTLHFVWDCLQRRFIYRTAGAGFTLNHVLANNGQGEYVFGLSMQAVGNGIILPNHPGNPTGMTERWHFNQQVLGVHFQGSTEDDNSVALSGGTWVSPDIQNGGLSATNLNTMQTTQATIVSFVVTPPEAGDPNHPPSAEGEGFGTSSDNSVYMPP